VRLAAGLVDWNHLAPPPFLQGVGERPPHLVRIEEVGGSNPPILTPGGGLVLAVGTALHTKSCTTGRGAVVACLLWKQGVAGSNPAVLTGYVDNLIAPSGGLRSGVAVVR
jgi:hypothetical protein